MQSNHARIKRSSGSSRERRRRRERTGKADRTELTLTDHLLLNSSCEPPGPSFHAFHGGAPTPQVRDPGTPSQCGSGRSYSLRICTRFWLNARTHVHTHSRAQNTRTYTLTAAAAAADGREVWLCWQRGPPLPPLASWWCYPSGTFLERIQPREIQSMPSFFSPLPPSLFPSLPGLPQPWFVKSIMQIAHVLHTARNLRTSVWTFLIARATGWHQQHGAKHARESIK